MTAPISNGPTTTRLHHYAGHYCPPIASRGSVIAHPSDLRAARGLPARSPSTRPTPPDLRTMRAHVLLSVAALCAGGRRPARPPRNAPRQTSVRHEACPPARRPRRELRSAHPARPARNAPRQTSVRREACPPARRPRCELRSACRLEARPGPAGLAPPSDRATMTTGTAATIPADHTPPTSRATAHRHRRKLAPQVLSGTKLSLINTSAEATGQNSPCSS